jgi:hypothetical protein
VKISTVASAKYVAADTSAIPAVASAITTVDCGRELGSDCDPMMTLWLVWCKPGWDTLFHQ